MKTITTPDDECPNCQAPVESRTFFPGEDHPQPNDAAICFQCGHLMAYGDDLRLRSLTVQERITIAGNKLLLEAQAYRVSEIERRKKQ